MENIPVQWLSLAILVTNICQLVVMWRQRQKKNAKETGGDTLDWRKVMIEDLRRYEGMQRSLELIPKKIRALEEQAASMKGARMGKEPVQGGTSYYEDRLIDNIVERERLTLNYKAAKILVERIDEALNILSKKERRVLELFYIRNQEGYIRRLCEELRYEERSVYRMKEDALRKITYAMYGLLDY